MLGHVEKIHNTQVVDIYFHALDIQSKFKELVAEEPAVSQLSVFGIGTNHGAQVYDNVSISRSALGACSFGSGSSHTFGGSVISRYRLNMVLANPTVKFDGRDVINDGKYVVNFV